MFYRISISLALIVLSITVKSQVNKEGITIPTSNASGIGAYGDVPMSMFRGLPVVKIPLVNLDEKGTKLDISLNYFSSGFRPDIHPSQVGRDWHLNYGGVITRVVNKFPDEWLSSEHNIYGFYHNNSLNNDNWNKTDSLISLANSAWENLIDKQPDEFTFNFFGYSGTFYLDHHRKWRVSSNENIQVIFEDSDMEFPFTHDYLSPTFTWNSFRPKTFGKFTLVDSKGIKYTFGTRNAIEYSGNLTPPDMNYRLWLIATSWHLIDVSFPDNSGGFSFEYERGPYQSNFQYFDHRDSYYDNNCATSNGSKGIYGKLISPVYIKRIIKKSDGLQVDFNYSVSNELKYPNETYFEVFRNNQNELPLSVPQNYFSFFSTVDEIPYYITNGIDGPFVINNSKFIWFKLENLTIAAKLYDGSSSLQPFEIIKLLYDENPSERLTLISVEKESLSEESELKEVYGLKYSPGLLPNYLTELSDHWGFFNGTKLPLNVSGGYDWLTEDPLITRQPNEFFSHRGILSEIIYPTGGKSVFEYESNDYGSYVLDIDRTYAYSIAELRRLSGGLRIKKITDYDGIGNSLTKQYFYVSGYNPFTNPAGLKSSGVLERQPVYSYEVTHGALNYWVKESIPILPMTSSGSIHPVGYSEVVEKESDGSYKIFKFTNHDNGFHDLNPLNSITATPVGKPAISRSLERGHLLYEGIFNSTGSLIKSEEINYIRLGGGADSNFVRSLQKEFKGYCKVYTFVPTTFWSFWLVPGTNDIYIHPGSFTPTYSNSTAYGYFTYKFLKSKVTTTLNTQTGGNPIISITNFQYDNIGNPIIIDIAGSKGETYSKRIQYSYQLKSTSAVYNDMYKRNITSVPLNTELFNNEVFIESERIEFDFINGGLIKPKRIIKKNGPSPEYVFQEFNKYDGAGNLTEIRGEDGIIRSYVWSYLGSRLVAEIIGVPFQEVTSVLSSNVFGGPYTSDIVMFTEIESLRNSFPKALITTYLYDYRFGIKIKSDHVSNKTFYEYDGLGRIKSVKDDQYNYIDLYEYGYNKRPYSQNIFYSVSDTGKFYKNNCGPCEIGKEILFIVPAGKYTSSLSQEDANSKAANDILLNGQQFANQQGICEPDIFCPFTNAYNFDSPNANFYTENGKGYMNLVVHPIINYYGSMWSTSIQVGNVGCSCRPFSIKTFNVTESDRTWEVTIEPNGNLFIKLINGPYPVDAVLYLQLFSSYDLN